MRELARTQVFELLERKPAPDKTELGMELIYGGQSGSTTFVTYRESAQGDLARPAFFQDVQYDLQSSRRITFRG